MLDQMQSTCLCHELHDDTLPSIASSTLSDLSLHAQMVDCINTRIKADICFQMAGPSTLIDGHPHPQASPVLAEAQRNLFFVNP
jgi:hypothetical protein